MARIAIDRAPSTALPRRFLLSAPVWGVIAGLLMVFDGELVLQTRWAPATLALAHALTLGVLGNAMFGTLLQFLPAAAGVHVRGGARAGWLLHALLNLGTLLLITGFHGMQPRLLLAAGAVLGAAFALVASMVLPGLLACAWNALRGNGRQARTVNTTSACAETTAVGIACAVVAALVTAALGVSMLLGLTGHRGLPLLPWVDVHAAWGVLGWGLGLLASVGGVVLPMFQGTHALPTRAQFSWLALLGIVLVVGALMVCVPSGIAERGAVCLRWGGALCMATFALAGLWLQWRAPRSRNSWLVHSWRAGLLALLAAAGVLAANGPPVLLGLLVLGIALPWLVSGMQQEIIAFLGWIELHRSCGRGVRLPSVQALLPETHKAGLFAAQVVAALILLVAALWPTPALARTAGVALAACHALLWLRLHGVGRKVRVFQAKTQRPEDNGNAR